MPSRPLSPPRLVRSTAPISRRELLRVGALGVSGLTLPGLLAAEEAAPRRGAARADAAIVIFLNGGPSHLDMWDMKPDAPVEIRGEFRPIPTSAAGVEISEHLPLLARQTHRAALIRSMRHGVNNAHALAVYTALTGHDRGDAGVIVGAGPEDHPNPGSVLTRLRPPDKNIVPYVALPYKTKEGAGGPPQPGFFGGFLGQSQDPFWVLSDPSADNFEVPSLALTEGVSPERLFARGELLSRLDDQLSRLGADPGPHAAGKFRQRALELLTTSDTRRAFRVQEEPAKLRDAYGRNIYGQSVLLARRLIEAGTRLVTVSWAPDANATWDTHGGNFKKLRQTLLPQFDAACATLLGDLADRGLLERTLVVVNGDFGRTPKVNNNDGGRDHWNACYTVMLAGGGARGGVVHGASDRIGGQVASDPTSPADLVATMYHLLGFDPATNVYDRLERPFPIARGGEVVWPVVG